MKRCVVSAGLVLAFSLAGLALAQSSAETPQATSLGDFARKLKSQRAGREAKSAKVFTNDDMPAAKPGDLVELSTTQPEGGEKAKGESRQGGTRTSSDAHDEKYYHEAMQALRDRKALHERELAVLDQKLGQNQTQFYADPNKTLQQEYSRDDINKKNSDMEKKKQEIDDDDKAIADLQDQLQREGKPAGWLR